MVSRGPSPRTDIMKHEIPKLLLRRGSIGFTGLLNEMNQLPESKRIGSPSTLSNCLKSLVKDGIIERDVETRKWSLTSFGRLSLTAYEHLSDLRLKERKVQFLVLKEAKPDAWWEIVEELARIVGLPRLLKDLPEEEVMKKLKAYTQQTQHAMARIWWAIASDMIVDIGGILAGVLLLRSAHPLLMDRDRTSRFAADVRTVVTLWGTSTSHKIEQLISAYASNLEVLAAWDKAIQEGKLGDGDRTVAFPEIVKKLEALGYPAPKDESLP